MAENIPRDRSGPSFEIVFDDRDIIPEEIPHEILARTIRAVQGLVAGDEIPDDEGSLKLSDIRRGSAVFGIWSPSPGRAIEYLRATARVIDDPAAIEEFPHVIAPIGLLSETARRIGCPIVLKGPGEGSPVLASVTATTYRNLSRFLHIGQTSILAMVEQVGDTAGLLCALRVPDRDRPLICRVERPEDAQILGENLGESVVVHGEATWIMGSWRLATFTVRRAVALLRESLSDSLRALREAGGKDWDLVEDPRAFLDEIRGKS